MARVGFAIGMSYQSYHRHTRNLFLATDPSDVMVVRGGGNVRDSEVAAMSRGTVFSVNSARREVEVVHSPNGAPNPSGEEFVSKCDRVIGLSDNGGEDLRPVLKAAIASKTPMVLYDLAGRATVIVEDPQDIYVEVSA